jgi:hypothetical protein
MLRVRLSFQKNDLTSILIEISIETLTNSVIYLVTMLINHGGNILLFLDTLIIYNSFAFVTMPPTTIHKKF